MVKVAAPCLSLGASGALGGAIVFSTWKGRPYVRELVKPANPRSGGQVGVRSMFKFLSQQWTWVPAGKRASWEDRADDQVVSPFNAYMGYNMARWRNFKAPALEYPPLEASAVPAAPTTTPTAGVRQISLSIADGAPAPDLAYIIHRSTSTGFTPAFATCIAVVRTEGTDPTVYIDTPLGPGTYYYRIQGCMDDGIIGTLEAEIDETVV